jgi:hypothetical protein
MVQKGIHQRVRIAEREDGGVAADHISARVVAHVSGAQSPGTGPDPRGSKPAMSVTPNRQAIRRSCDAPIWPFVMYDSFVVQR